MARSGASTVDYDAEMRRLEAQMRENIERIQRIGRTNLEMAAELGAPPEALPLVQQAVEDPNVTDDATFVEYLKCKLPTVGGMKSAALSALKVAFELAMFAYTLPRHQEAALAPSGWYQAEEPWGEPGPMCDRNSTWPPDCWPNCPAPAAPPAADDSNSMAPPDFMGLLAKPKGASVVDEVFTKEAEARRAR